MNNRIFVGYFSAADAMYSSGVNYEVGDELTPKDDPWKVMGKCTGFDGGCVLINGKNHGGKYFFMKSEIVNSEVVGGSNEQ
jgi:hypothetical protein